MNGLYRVEQRGGTWQAKPEDLGINELSTVTEDASHQLIIGTHDGGFHFYNPKTRELSAPKLPNHGICRFIKDGMGYFWITTMRGLYRYNSTDSTFTTFNISDGLTTDQFSRNSGFMDASGTIFMGTMSALVSFDPAMLETRSAHTVIRFLTLQPEGRSLLFADEITLPYDASFTIEYAPTFHAAARALWFRYRLEGTNADWTVTQNAVPISFNKLAPGDYALQLQVTDEYGHWPEETKVLRIRVRQPWWWTWTARLAYLLLAALTLYLAFRNYTRRQRERQQLADEQADAERYREVLQSKIQFFTTIAHEIRTPLTLITGSLERLRKRDNGQEVNTMRNNTERLLNLVNQLLDFRKIESSAFLMNFEEVNLSSLLRELFKNFAPLARQRNVDYQFHVEAGESISVLADREALTKIISNLLSNALKYCDSYVRLLLAAQGDKVVLSVSNDGPLIPKEEVAQIFKPFHQYYGTSARATINGSGLGLSLARSLAEMHNGTLTYDENDRRQNTFVLCLKAKVNEVGEAQAATADSTEATTGDLTAASKATSPARPEEQPAATTILIVDDEYDLRQFVGEELAATYHILEANNGQEALGMLREKEVSLVVTDLMMPVMDGTALCQAIRADVSLCHLPIVVLTAKVSLQDHIDVLNCGADAYIEKPFSTAQLLAQIANLLHSRELLRQTFVSSPYAQAVIVAANDLDKEFLDKLNAYLNEHLADHLLSVESLGAEMNMSNSTLYRKVKSVTSLSPADYIRLLRLKRGAEMLAERRYRVKEIAERLGFSSTAYFTTSFMRQFGMTPTEFAKAQSVHSK